MKKNRRAIVLTTALAVSAGATATFAGAQTGPQPSYTKGPMMTVPPNASPQVAEGIRQLNEWRTKGSIPPLPVWDTEKNDYKRNPDGSLYLYDTHKDLPPTPSPESQAKAIADAQRMTAEAQRPPK